MRFIQYNCFNGIKYQSREELILNYLQNEHDKTES